jgi:actin-like ATPase involved in cell morphogenesis
MGWVLAIDFGTSYTTAAFADDGGSPVMLEVENSRYLPSAVVADTEGHLLTGNAAARQVGLFPERAERVPKRALVTGARVLLGGREFAPAELAGAVLSRVYAEAVRFHGDSAPRQVILTHPARWGRQPLDRLGEAAGLAGIADPVFVSEPEAAAWFYAPPVDGQVVAVFDLGGGTLDTAVLKAVADRFAVAGPPGGDPDLGGEDLDELLLDRVRDMARERDDEVSAALDGPGTRAARDRAALRSEVTTAKEALSDHTSYEVVVPGFDEGFRVTRPEFEGLIKDALASAVAEMLHTITEAGVEPGRLAGMYLTGGSSRIPLVAQRLAAALGMLPQLRDDPKAVVVLGALKASATPAPPPPRPLPSQASITLTGEEHLAGEVRGLGWKTVASVEWTANGELAVATGFFEIWNTNNRKKVRTIDRRGARSIFAIASAPSPDEFATINTANEGAVRIWKGRRSREVEVPGWDFVTGVAWCGNHLAVAGRDGTVCVLDPRTGKEIRRLPGRAEGLLHSSLAWSPDGELIASSGEDSGIAIWDWATGRHLRTLAGHEYYPTIAWSRDGAQLAVSDLECIRVWNPGTGSLVSTLPVPAGDLRGVSSLEWTHDSRYVVAFDGTAATETSAPVSSMVLWHAESGTLLKTWDLRNEKTMVPSAGIALSPRGKQVVVINKGSAPVIYTITGI